MDVCSEVEVGVGVFNLEGRWGELDGEKVFKRRKLLGVVKYYLLVFRCFFF